MISKEHVKVMNELVSSGKTISQIAKQFTQYDYWDIYYTVEESSLLGRKRSITNRLRNLEGESSVKKRRVLIDEIEDLIQSIYEQAKDNGSRLTKIDRILRKPR